MLIALRALREYESDTKSFICQAYDLILKPLNVVLNTEKKSFTSGKWEKSQRAQHLAFVVICAIAAVAFSGLILAALVLKSHSLEHKERVFQYKINKKEAYFVKEGFIIENFERDEDTFSFTVRSTLSELPITTTYTWYGKVCHWTLDDRN